MGYCRQYSEFQIIDSDSSYGVHYAIHGVSRNLYFNYPTICRFLTKACFNTIFFSWGKFINHRNSL